MAGDNRLRIYNQVKGKYRKVSPTFFYIKSIIRGKAMLKLLHLLQKMVNEKIPEAVEEKHSLVKFEEIITKTLAKKTKEELKKDIEVFEMLTMEEGAELNDVKEEGTEVMHLLSSDIRNLKKVGNKEFHKRLLQTRLVFQKHLVSAMEYVEKKLGKEFTEIKAVIASADPEKNYNTFKKALTTWMKNQDVSVGRIFQLKRQLRELRKKFINESKNKKVIHHEIIVIHVNIEKGTYKTLEELEKDCVALEKEESKYEMSIKKSFYRAFNIVKNEFLLLYSLLDTFKKLDETVLIEIGKKYLPKSEKDIADKVKRSMELLIIRLCRQKAQAINVLFDMEKQDENIVRAAA